MTIHDRVTCGAIAGMIGTAAKMITHYICKVIGVTSLLYPSLIDIVILKIPAQKTYFFWPFLLGSIIHVVNGGILGIIIIYTLTAIGRQYLWFKTFLLSSLIWLIGPTILVTLCYPGLPLGFYYVSLVDHWVFGFITVFLINKLYLADE